MIRSVANKTVSGSLPMLAIFLVIIVTTRITYMVINKEKFSFYQECFKLFFICYVLILFQLVTSSDISSYGGINYIPFTEIFRYHFGSRLFVLNVVGNIAIFIPFGYFITSYLKTNKKMPIFMITLVTSLCIELVQLYIGRSFDIDDIILNCVGGVLGHIIYKFLKRIDDHLPKFLRSEIFYSLLCIIIIFLFYFYLRGYIKLGVFLWLTMK